MSRRWVLGIFALAFLSGGAIAANEFDSLRLRLVGDLEAAEIYPFPMRCVDWRTTPVGKDSVRFIPSVAAIHECRLLRIQDEWIVPRAGGEPVFVRAGKAPRPLSEYGKTSEGAGGSGAASGSERIETALAGGGSITKVEGTSGSEIRSGARRTSMSSSEAGREDASKKRRNVTIHPQSKDVVITRGGATRSSESLLRVLRSYSGGFSHALARSMGDVPEFPSGEILLRLEIAPDGSTATASVVRSSTGVSSVDDQMAKSARRMRFAKVSGDTVGCDLLLRYEVREP